MGGVGNKFSGILFILGGFLYGFDGVWYKYCYLFYYILFDLSKEKICYWNDESEYLEIIKFWCVLFFVD